MTLNFIGPGAPTFEKLDEEMKKAEADKAKANGKGKTKKQTKNDAKARAKLLKTIRALRAKANDHSVTDHESESYSAKVAEMMAEHGVSEEELEFVLEDVDPRLDDDELSKSAGPVIDCADVLGAFETTWVKAMAGETTHA